MSDDGNDWGPKKNNKNICLYIYNIKCMSKHSKQERVHADRGV